MDPLLAMFLEGLDSYQEKNSHQKVQLFHFLTAISTIDDLNYSEKIDTYYIVNVPYVFLMCWKVVKPLLQERTRRKIQVLQGCGKEELLKVMDYASLPHFCRKEDSKSSKHHAS
ncbi:Phosphatidylinositol/phosphatidylcholine transfer protein SFH12 [Glycine max]|nr:Phosphatidylinositol/phosphatidylcholine transfer protein SFH12 [Glycine max]